MIIDCHAHIGKGILLNDVFQIDCTAERLEYLADKGKVDKTVLFPVLYNDYSEPNREIAELASKNKKFIGFARAKAGAPDAPEKLEYDIKELGLKGVKIDSTGGRGGGFPTREFMEKVRELKVPLLTHAGSELPPMTLEGVVKSYPEVTIIIAHMGTDINWSHMFSYPLDAIYLARKYKNVYLDTSAATWIQYILEWAVDEVSADKLVFGSDAPWFYPALNIACINDLEISDSDKAKILGENMARILKL